ncbi:N-6 DNA methylase (plasmid) [Candidatus Liberibacter asiaticus]
MVNTTWTKHSFSAGELSPRLLQSRKDLSLHAQGVAKSRNLIPLRYGPLVSMPLMQEYRDCRLDPRSNRVFSFSIPDGGYALMVFGDKKLQIVVVRSSTKWSPALFGKTYKTPYTFKDNKSLDYAVFGSTAVFVHKDHPPHHLLYIQDGDKISFTFDEIKFLPPPWLGDGMISGVKSNAKLSISQADTSTARITSDMKIFKPLDKGRSIRLGCHPPEWAKNTNYSIGAYIVADDKVYRSLTTGRSGDRFGYSKGATYVKDNNITWITVLNLSSKTSRESASGAVDPYYVWGDIKDVSKDGRSISVAPQSQTLFQAGVSVVSWFMSAWGEQEGYPSHVTFHNNRLLFSGSKGDELWSNDPYCRNQYGLPSKTNGDFAWIQHMFASLNDTGRMAVVLPHGVLFRGRACGVIRTNLLHDDRIEAVIGIAPNIFYGTGIASSILVLRKSRPHSHQGHVLIINAEEIFTKGRGKNSLTNEQSDAIYRIYQSQVQQGPKAAEIKGVACWIPLSKIAENDFNLSVGRYAQKPQEEATITVEEALKEFRKTLGALERAEEELEAFLVQED